MNTIKKVFLTTAILLALLVSIAMADITWEIANQVTIAWDPVTTLSDGTPIPSGDSILYNVYTKPFNSPNINPAVGPLTTTQATITFTQEGKYLVGVKATRQDSSSNKLSESAISWSDDPVAVSSAGTFGVIYFLAPAGPKNLR